MIKKKNKKNIIQKILLCRHQNLTIPEHDTCYLCMYKINYIIIIVYRQ